MDTLLIILIIVLLIILYNYTMKNVEGYKDVPINTQLYPSSSSNQTIEAELQELINKTDKKSTEPSQATIITPSQENTVETSDIKKYNAKDFLPKDINNDWFDVDFSMAKNITDNNLINTDKYIIGTSSISSSLKLATHDIRGSIPTKKHAVSPWNNSSVEPDYNIKPLC